MLGLCPIGAAPLCALDDDVINIAQAFSFGQTVYVGQDIIMDMAQSLIFNQTLVFDLGNIVTQNLAFTQTLTSANTYNNTLTQNLVLLQNVVANYVYGFNTIHDLNFYQDVEIANVYEILLCQCLIFQQKILQAIELSITQTLTFEWLEKEVIYQYLQFMQTVTTNWSDADDCCGLLGIPDKNAGQTLQMSQTVNCAMVYNITTTQSLTFRNTASWRP